MGLIFKTNFDHLNKVTSKKKNCLFKKENKKSSIIVYLYENIHISNTNKNAIFFHQIHNSKKIFVFFMV